MFAFGMIATSFYLLSTGTPYGMDEERYTMFKVIGFFICIGLSFFFFYYGVYLIVKNRTIELEWKVVELTDRVAKLEKGSD